MAANKQKQTHFCWTLLSLQNGSCKKTPKRERERETKRTQGLLYFSPFSPLVKSDSSVCLSATPRLLYASMLLYYCTLRSRKPAAASGPTYDLHRHLANGINDSLETETAGNTETETQKVQEDWTTEIGPEMQIKY